MLQDSETDQIPTQTEWLVAVHITLQAADFTVSTTTCLSQILQLETMRSNAPLAVPPHATLLGVLIRRTTSHRHGGGRFKSDQRNHQSNGHLTAAPRRNHPSLQQPKLCTGLSHASMQSQQRPFITDLAAKAVCPVSITRVIHCHGRQGGTRPLISKHHIIVIVIVAKVSCRCNSTSHARSTSEPLCVMRLQTF